MNPVVTHIKWIMLLSGILTCTMVYAFIFPQAAMVANFGEQLQGQGAELVVRNWGALITIIGAMLIYGAFKPNVRSFALIAAGASKLIFAALVLSQGSRLFAFQVGIAVAVDMVWVVLFAWYLISNRSSSQV
jgi:hypothetical protein